jgi:hypothetical protein
MKIKQHHQAAKEPLFERGVEFTLRVAATRTNPEQQLGAVSTLLRIAELVKPWQPRLAKALPGILSEALPPLQSASDPDDRYYIAKLWHYEEQPWFRSFLATGAVEEEVSERVRGECIPVWSHSPLIWPAPGTQQGRPYKAYCAAGCACMAEILRLFRSSDGTSCAPSRLSYMCG